MSAKQNWHWKICIRVTSFLTTKDALTSPKDVHPDFGGSAKNYPPNFPQDVPASNQKNSPTSCCRPAGKYLSIVSLGVWLRYQLLSGFLNRRGQEGLGSPVQTFLDFGLKDLTSSQSCLLLSQQRARHFTATNLECGLEYIAEVRLLLAAILCNVCSGGYKWP